MEPELLADYACETGEGPLWNAAEQTIYWCDIPQGRMFRLDPATGEHEQFYAGPVVGGFTFQQDGAILLFMEKGRVATLRDGALTTVVPSIEAELDSRFNDVIADPCGRVFCGTMSTDTQKGTLYRLDTDGSIRPVQADVGCSNGMGFTPDRRRMYHTDSFRREIYLYDYDGPTGAIENRRLFASLPETDGFPDGMTVDAEGCVWSAVWDGGCLIRFDPHGKEMLRVAFPARKVSSAVWGGSDYRDLYVTTAGGNVKETDGEHAGALFRLRPGVQGVPEFASRIGLT